MQQPKLLERAFGHCSRDISALLLRETGRRHSKRDTRCQTLWKPQGLKEGQPAKSTSKTRRKKSEGYSKLIQIAGFQARQVAAEHSTGLEWKNSQQLLMIISFDIHHCRNHSWRMRHLHVEQPLAGLQVEVHVFIF